MCLAAIPDAALWRWARRNPPATASTPRRRSTPKPTPMSAWVAWQLEGSTSSGGLFLDSVSSWMEGTAAQLLRPAWPTGARRPTPNEVQDRLGHHLGMAARGARSTYLEGLALARRGVIEELGLERRRHRVRPGRLLPIEPRLPRA
jgi:hypothetical protein